MKHPRTPRLKYFCYNLKEAETLTNTWKKMNDEELCNLALTLIHQSVRLIEGYLRMLEQRFVTQGGITENMTKARLTYRNTHRSSPSQQPPSPQSPQKTPKTPLNHSHPHLVPVNPS
jgi:four helix bundle suffix protein